MILYAKFGNIIPVALQTNTKNIVNIFDTLANFSPFTITDIRCIIIDKVELVIYFNSTQFVTIS